MPAIAKILLVDDNPKYLRDVLPMYGYEVDIAYDGLQALEILKAKKKSYDLVILDVMMPNIDGWEVLKTVRNDSQYQDMPVIMLTALDSPQKQISGLKTGADDYITKPFALPNLLARIEALLRRSKWSKEKHKSHISIPETTQDTLTPLTKKEKEVLQLVAQGKNNHEIAEILVVREVTIKSHLNNIFKKLHVSNRTQSVLVAMQNHLLD